MQSNTKSDGDEAAPAQQRKGGRRPSAGRAEGSGAGACARGERVGGVTDGVNGSAAVEVEVDAPPLQPPLGVAARPRGQRGEQHSSVAVQVHLRCPAHLSHQLGGQLLSRREEEKGDEG